MEPRGNFFSGEPLFYLAVPEAALRQVSVKATATRNTVVLARCRSTPLWTSLHISSIYSVPAITCHERPVVITHKRFNMFQNPQSFPTIGLTNYSPSDKQHGISQAVS
jgi:hypothetical protein